MNKAKDDTIIVKVGTSTNENTCGTYFVINFSNLAKNNDVNIAGNIPPWNATAGTFIPNKFQYSTLVAVPCKYSNLSPNSGWININPIIIPNTGFPPNLLVAE